MTLAVDLSLSRRGPIPACTEFLERFLTWWKEKDAEAVKAVRGLLASYILESGHHYLRKSRKKQLCLEI